MSALNVCLCVIMYMYLYDIKDLHVHVHVDASAFLCGPQVIVWYILVACVDGRYQIEAHIHVQYLHVYIHIHYLTFTGGANQMS